MPRSSRLLLQPAVRLRLCAKAAIRLPPWPPESNVLSIFDGEADAQLNLDGTAYVSIGWRTIHTVILWPRGYTARGNPLVVFDADGKRHSMGF